MSLPKDWTPNKEYLKGDMVKYTVPVYSKFGKRLLAISSRLPYFLRKHISKYINRYVSKKCKIDEKTYVYKRIESGTL